MTLEVNGGREPGLQVTEDAPSLQKLKIEGYFTRAELTRDILLELQAECRIKNSKKIAEILYREIKEASLKKRRSVSFVRDIYRKLLVLNDFHQEIKEKKKRFPFSKILVKVVVEYIQLEHNVLYTSKRNNLESEKEVEGRVINLIENMFLPYDKKPIPAHCTNPNSLFVLKVLYAVASEYRTDNNLFGNLVRKLLKKLDLWDTVKRSTMGCCNITTSNPAVKMLSLYDINELPEEYDTDDEDPLSINCDLSKLSLLTPVEKCSTSSLSNQQSTSLLDNSLDVKKTSVNPVNDVETICLDDSDEDMVVLGNNECSAKTCNSDLNKSVKSDVQINLKSSVKLEAMQSTKTKPSDYLSKAKGNKAKSKSSKSIVNKDGFKQSRQYDLMDLPPSTSRCSNITLKNGTVVKIKSEHQIQIVIEEDEDAILNKYIEEEPKIDVPIPQDQPQDIAKRVRHKEIKKPIASDNQVNEISSSEIFDIDNNCESIRQDSDFSVHSVEITSTTTTYPCYQKHELNNVSRVSESINSETPDLSSIDQVHTSSLVLRKSYEKYYDSADSCLTPSNVSTNYEEKDNLENFTPNVEKVHNATKTYDKNNDGSVDSNTNNVQNSVFQREHPPIGTFEKTGSIMEEFLKDDDIRKSILDVLNTIIDHVEITNNEEVQNSTEVVNQDCKQGDNKDTGVVAPLTIQCFEEHFQENSTTENVTLVNPLNLRDKTFVKCSKLENGSIRDQSDQSKNTICLEKSLTQIEEELVQDGKENYTNKIGNDCSDKTQINDEIMKQKSEDSYLDVLEEKNEESENPVDNGISISKYESIHKCMVGVETREGNSYETKISLEHPVSVDKDKSFCESFLEDKVESSKKIHIDTNEEIPKILVCDATDKYQEENIENYNYEGQTPLENLSSINKNEFEYAVSKDISMNVNEETLKIDQLLCESSSVSKISNCSDVAEHEVRKENTIKYMVENKNVQESKCQHQIILDASLSDNNHCGSETCKADNSCSDVLKQNVNDKTSDDTSDVADKNGDYYQLNAIETDNSHADILTEEINEKVLGDATSDSVEENENQCTSETRETDISDKHVLEIRNLQESKQQRQIVSNTFDILNQGDNEEILHDTTSDEVDKNGDYCNSDTADIDNSHSDILMQERISHSKDKIENRCSSETSEATNILSATLQQEITEEILDDVTADSVCKIEGNFNLEINKSDDSHSDILKQETMKGICDNMIGSVDKDGNLNSITRKPGHSQSDISIQEINEETLDDTKPEPTEKNGGNSDILEQEVTQEILNGATVDSADNNGWPFSAETSKADHSGSNILIQKMTKETLDELTGSADKSGHLTSFTSKADNSYSDIEQETNQGTLCDPTGNNEFKKDKSFYDNAGNSDCKLHVLEEKIPEDTLHNVLPTTENDVHIEDLPLGEEKEDESLLSESCSPILKDNEIQDIDLDVISQKNQTRINDFNKSEQQAHEEDLEIVSEKLPSSTQTSLVEEGDVVAPDIFEKDNTIVPNIDTSISNILNQCDKENSENFTIHTLVLPENNVDIETEKQELPTGNESNFVENEKEGNCKILDGKSSTIQKKNCEEENNVTDLSSFNKSGAMTNEILEQIQDIENTTTFTAEVPEQQIQNDDRQLENMSTSTFSDLAEGKHNNEGNLSKIPKDSLPENQRPIDSEEESLNENTNFKDLEITMEYNNHVGVDKTEKSELIPLTNSVQNEECIKTVEEDKGNLNTVEHKFCEKDNNDILNLQPSNEIKQKDNQIMPNKEVDESSQDEKNKFNEECNNATSVEAKSNIQRDYDVELMPIEDETTLSKCTTKDVELSSTTDYESHTLVIEEPITSVSTFAYYQSTENYHFAASQLLSEKNTLDHNKATSLENSEPDLEKVIGEIGGVAQPTCCSITYSIPDDGGDFDAPVQIRIEELPNKEMYSHSEQLVSEDLKITEVENVHERCLSIDNGLNVLAGTASECQYLPVLHENNKKKGITNKQARSGLIITNKHSFVHRKNFLHKTISRNRINYKPNEFKGVVGKQSPHRVYDATYNIGHQLSSSDDSCDSFKDNLVIAEEVTKNDLSKSFEEESLEDVILIDTPSAQKGIKLGKPVKASKSKNVQDKLSNKSKKEKKPKNVTFNDEIVTIGRCTRSKGMPLFIDTESTLKNKKNKNADCLVNVLTSNNTLLTSGSKSRSIKGKSILKDTISTQPKSQRKKDGLKKDKSVPPIIENKPTTDYSIENILHMSYNLRNGLTIERIDCPTSTVHNNVPLNLSKKAMLNPEVSIEIINDKSQKMMDLKAENTAPTKSRRSINKRKPKQTKSIEDVNKFDVKSTLESTKCQTIEKIELTTNREEKMGQDKIKIWQPFEDVKEDIPKLNDHIQQTIVNNLVDENIEHSDTIMTDVSQNEIMSNVTEIAPIKKYGNSLQKRASKKQEKSIKERKCKKRNFLRSMKETHDVSHKQGLLEICLTEKPVLLEKLDESDHIKKATNMEVSKNDKERSEVEVVESEGIQKTKATQRQTRTSRNNKNNDLQNGLTSKETVTSLAENIVEACKIKDISSANAIKDIDVRDKKYSRKNKRNKLIDDLAEDNSQEKATFLKNYELMGKVTTKDKKQGRTTRRSSLENMVSQCSASIAPHETSKNLTSYEKEKSKEFTDHKQRFIKTADNFSDISKVLTRNTSKQRLNDKYLQKLRSSKQNMVRSKIGSKHFKRNQKNMVTIGNLDIPKKSKNVNKQNDEMKSNIPFQMTDVLNVDSEHLKINATTVNTETTAACCQNNIQPENNTETLDDDMKCNIAFKTTAALKVDSEDFEINTATMNEGITIDCCQNNIQPENNIEIPDDEMKSNTAVEMRDVLKIHSKDLKINATTMNQEITVDFCQNNIQPGSNPETKSTIIFKTTDVLKVDSEDIEEYTTTVNKVAIECPQNNIQPENNTETPDIESEESKDNHQTVESNDKTNPVSVKVASEEDEIHIGKEISELCEESTRLKENASASTEEGSTKSLIKVQMQAHVESVQTDDVPTEDTFISEKHPKESQVKNNTDDIEKHDVTEKAVPDVQTEEVLHEKYVPVLSTTEDCLEDEVDISESVSLPIESNNEVQREENIARKDLTGKADNIDVPKEQNTTINQEKIVPMEDEVNFHKERYENQTENALIHADSDTELITDGNTFTDEENKLKDTLLHVKEDTELNEQSNTITNLEDRPDDTLSCEKPGVMPYEEESIHILQECTSDVSIPANNNNEKLYKEENVIVDQQSKLEVATQVLEDDTGTDFPTVHDYATEKLRKSAFLGELGIYEKPNVCLNVELYNVSKDNTMITTISDEVEESPTVENVKLTEDTQVIVPNDETKAEIENNSKILPTQPIITEIKVLKSLQINEDIFNHDESSLISEQKPIKSDKASNIESLSDQIDPTSLSKNNPLTIEVKLPVLNKDNTPNLAVNASYHRDTPEANPELIGKRKQMDEIVNNNEENCKKTKWSINESVVANIPENITHMFNLKPVVKIRKIHDLSAYRDQYVQSLRKNTEEKAKDKSRSIRSKGRNLDAIVDKLVTSLKTNEMWKQFRFQSQTDSDVSTLTTTESVAVSSNSNSDVHSYCEETYNKSSMEVALEKNEKVKDQEELKDNDNVDEIRKPKINAIEEELKKSTVQNEVPIGGQINKADTEIQLEETVNKNLIGESVGNLFSNENTDTSIELETVNNKQIQEDINNSKDDISKEETLHNITKKDVFSEKVERMEVSEVIEVYSPKDQIRLNEDDSVVEEVLLHTDEKLQLESNNSEDIELTTVSEEKEATELFSEQVNKSFAVVQQQCKEVKASISLINTHNDKQTEQLYHLDEPPDGIQLRSQCNIIEENALLSKCSQEETVFASCEDVSEEKENNIGTQSKELLTNIPVDDNAGVQPERNLTDQLEMKTSPENYNQLNVDQLCYDDSKETFNSEHSLTYESTSIELECNGQDLLTVSVEHSNGRNDMPNCTEEAVNNVHNEGKLSNIISLESPSQVNEIPSNNQCKTITQETSVLNNSEESPLTYSKQLPEQVEDSMSNESFDSNESTLKARPAKELLEKYKFMQDESYDVSNTECDLVTNSPEYHISTETVESAKDRPETSSVIEPICNNILETAPMEPVEKETHIEENIQFDNSSKEPYQIAEEVIDEGTTDGDINTEQGAQTSYEGTNVMADNLASFSTKNPQKLQNIILDYNNQPMSHSILNVSFDADQFLSDVMLDKRLPYLESCSELLENAHPPNMDLQIHNPQTKVIPDEQEIVLNTDGVAANIGKKSNVEVSETGSEVNISNSNGFNDALGCNETIDVDDPQLAEKVKSMGFVKIGSESSDHDYINYGGPLLVGKYEQPHNNESPEMSPSRQVSIGAHTENVMVPVSSHEALVSNVAEQYNSLAYNFMDTQDYNFMNKMMANVMHHQTSIADTSNQFDNTITFSNDNLLSSTRIDDTNGPDFTINSFPLSDLALCDIEDFYPSETISPEKIIVNPLKTLHTIPKSVIESPQKVTVKVNEYEFASTDNLFKDDAFVCPTTPKLNTSDSLIECDKKIKEREVIKIKVKTKAEKKMIALTEAFPIRRNTRTPVSAPRLPKRKVDTVEAKNEVVKTSKDNGETNSIHKGDQQKRKSESSSLNHELTPEIVSDKSPEKRSVPITKQSFLENILSTSFESQEELEMKPDKLAKLIFATFDDTDLLNVDSPNILESPTRVTVKINEYEYASTDDLYSTSCKKAKKDSTSDKKLEDIEKQKPVGKKLEFSSPKKHENSNATLKPPENVNDNKIEQVSEQESNSSTKEDSKQKDSLDKVIGKHSNDSHSSMSSKVDEKVVDDTKVEIKSKKSECKNEDLKKQESLKEANTKVVQKEDLKIQKNVEKVIENQLKVKETVPTHIKIPKIQPEQNKSKGKPEDDKVLRTSKEIPVPEALQEKSTLLSTTIPLQKYQSEVQRWRPDIPNQYNQKVKSGSNNSQYSRPAYSVNQRSESKNAARPPTYVRKEDISKPNDKSNHNSGTSKNYYQSSSNHLAQPYYIRQDSWKYDRPPSRSDQRKSTYGRSERTNMQEPSKSSSRNPSSNDKSYWDHKNSSRHQSRSERITANDYQKQNDQRSSTSCYSRIPQCRSERNMEVQYPQLDNTAFSRNKYDDIKRRSYEKSLRNQVNNTHERYHQLMTTSKPSERQKRKSPPMEHSGSSKMRKFEEERKEVQQRKRGSSPSDEAARKRQKDYDEIFSKLREEGNINKNFKLKYPMQTPSSVNCSGISQSSSDNWFEKFPEQFSLKEARYVTFGGLTRRSEKHS